MKKIIVALVGFSVANFAFSQTIYSLDSLQKLAKENSKELAIAKLKTTQTQYEKSAAFTKFLPKITIQGGYVRNFEELSLISKDMLLPIGSLNGNQFSFTPEQINNPIEIRNGNIVLLDKNGQPFNPQAEPSKILWKEYAVIPKESLTFDTRNLFIASLNFIQPLFMGGKIIAYNKIARLKTDLSNYEADECNEDIEIFVEQLYWKIVSLVNKHDAIVSFIELLNQTEKELQILIETGISAPSERLNVAVKRDEAELNELQILNAILLSKMSLAQLCGIQLNNEIILKDEGLENLHSVPQERVSLDSIISRRWEIKKLTTVGDIQKQKERIERSALLPSISFIGTYTGTNPAINNGFQKHFSFDWHLGILVNIPLLHWGENIYSLKAAKCESNITRLRLEEAKEKINLQAEQSYLRLTESWRKLQMTEINLERAGENLKAANEGFREGVIPASSLMEAQTAWVKARAERIDAEIEIKINEMNYKKITGRL